MMQILRTQESLADKADKTKQRVTRVQLNRKTFGSEDKQMQEYLKHISEVDARKQK